MQPDNERGGPSPGTASEDLATPQQLDLTVTDGTARSDTRTRTEPDPAARRRNLEHGRRSAAAPREVADAGAEAAIANTPIGARIVAERCLDELAAAGQPFDAEDLRARIGGHILGAHPNALSAVFRIAAQQGVIRHVGYRESTRPEARGRVIRVWQGTGVTR